MSATTCSRRLGDNTLRSIARWKLECYTNAEIGFKLDCKERTVEAQIAAHSRLLGECRMKNMPAASSPPPALPGHLDDICDRFEKVWKQAVAGGQRPRLEEFLAGVAETELPTLLPELLGLEIDYRRELGETLSFEEYQHRFPAPSAGVAGPRSGRGQGGIGGAQT